MEVLPGRGNDPIVCLIYEISPDEHPHYEALSYVWGDPSALVSCLYLVDSATAGVQLERFFQGNENHAHPQKKPCLLPIAANLRCALFRLRYPERSRHLWVDAICINQKDSRERSSQVRMMTRIFGQAARVVAHLGDEKDGSEILPSVLQKIRDHDTYRQKQGRNGLDHFWDELEMPPKNLEVWQPIRSFLDRPWFRRSWIIQEVLLAQDIQMYCGNWELEWGLFEGPARIAAASARDSGDAYGWQFHAAKGSQNLAQELINSRVFEKANHLNLLELLDAFRLFPVTKRQDKIYSLLGICADKDDPAYTVDYLEPSEDTFTRYSKRFVEKGYGAKVLYCAANSPREFDGPSWVANWDNEDFPGTRLTSLIEGSDYSTSGTSSSMMNVLPDSSNLQISGIIVDKIEQVSSFSPAVDHRECRRDIYKAWNELQSLLKKENPYHGRCSDEIIWRTMICDKQGESLLENMSKEARSVLAWDHKEMSNEAKSWYSVYGDPKRTKEYYPATESIKRAHEERFMQTAVQYAGTSLNMMQWKRFAASLDGNLASVPVSSLPGDILCIVMGAAVPFVLRPLHGGYRLVGECYVHGLMNGEALKMIELEVETLTLV
ncbi:HET-domain-containing protein [Setomelanomma holmii]|uniref:HET-domain-containing protein n=1 Tax=Setomelanomma holmii TaxID=210430 RepID=A0A9P4H7W8_9PLEO|nr:HET-domain-containing protein [Setomelanomma holmii]